MGKKKSSEKKPPVIVITTPEENKSLPEFDPDETEITVIHEGPAYICENCHRILKVPEDAIDAEPVSRKNEEKGETEYYAIMHYTCPKCDEDNIVDEQELTEEDYKTIMGAMDDEETKNKTQSSETKHDISSSESSEHEDGHNSNEETPTSSVFPSTSGSGSFGKQSNNNNKKDRKSNIESDLSAMGLKEKSHRQK